MLRQLGNILGSCYAILFPFRNPKRDFFFFTSLKSLFLVMLLLGKVTGHHEILYGFLMIGLGFLKLQLACIFYIAGTFAHS